MVTAGLTGSVLNGLDCQAVLLVSSSLIELRGLERSKRVSFVIGLKSLVVVFGRRALIGSDQGPIGLRSRSSARRVAPVVAAVIGLIGLRALNWGIARSVPIGGYCRDERVSRFDVFSLDQGRDRNLPLGGGLGGGLFTGCEGGVGRERVLTGLGCVRRSSAIVQSSASKRRSRRVPRVFWDQPFSRCGVGRRSPAVVQAVFWDRFVSAQPRVGGDHPRCRPRRRLGSLPRVFGDRALRSSSRDSDVVLARMGIDRGIDRRPERGARSLSERPRRLFGSDGDVGLYPACAGIDRRRGSLAVWRVAPLGRGSTAAGPVPRLGLAHCAAGDRLLLVRAASSVCSPRLRGLTGSRVLLLRVCGDRPLEDPPVRCPGPIPPCTPHLRESTCHGAALDRLPRIHGDRPTSARPRMRLDSSTLRTRGSTWPSTVPAARISTLPRVSGDEPDRSNGFAYPRPVFPLMRGSTASGAGGNFGLCPAGAGIFRRRGAVGRRVLAVREAC